MPNLVLIRKPGESIVINDEITITIVGHDGLRTKVAIEAPQHIKIRRGELQRSDSKQRQFVSE